MKKGFTLIELLATVVIIAIIAAIAIPMILGIIDKTKKGALKNSTYGAIEAATLYYARNSLEPSVKQFTLKDGKFVSGSDTLEYKGSISGTGDLIIDANGDITICINSEKIIHIKVTTLIM